MFRPLEAGSTKTFGKIPVAVIRDSMLFDIRCPHLITGHSGRGAVVEGDPIRLCEGAEKVSLWTLGVTICGEGSVRGENTQTGTNKAARHYTHAAPFAAGGMVVELSELGSCPDSRDK